MKDYYNASTLYVSYSTGSDSYTGLSPFEDGLNNGPFKTLEHALDFVGVLRYDGILQPYTIKLMDDVYPVSKTITLEKSRDWPFALIPHNVTVEPYGEERVTLLGGERIEGFGPASFNGVSCLCASVPRAKDGWTFTDLYVNGHRAKSTRYPAEGFLSPESVENPGTELFDSSDWIIVREGDLPDDIDFTGAVLSYEHLWIDEHTAVKSYDPVTRKLVFESASRFTIAIDGYMPYYIENLPFTFRNPGEWYLDAAEGKLYYIPEEGEDAASLTAYAPVVSRLLDIVGTPEAPADGLRFRRLRFACTKGDYQSIGIPDGHKQTADSAYKQGKAYASDMQSCSGMHGAINLTYAENCTFTDCEITLVGNHGIRMGHGCVGNLIEKCHFHTLGAGGVLISGGLADYEPHTYARYNRILDCHIENGGLRHLCGCGVAIIHGSHNEVSHCEIHDFFYTGISVGFVWGYVANASHHNRLTRNHIYNLGKGRLSDMGGIYLLGPQTGTLLEGNLIHDVTCRRYGGWAIYTDEGSSYMTVENNICYNCSSNCYHQHYGLLNTIRNNIFAFSREPLLCMGRREARLGLIIEGNIFLSDGEAAYMGMNRAMFSADRNLFWNTAKQGSLPYVKTNEGIVSTDERVSVYGQDEHSIVADPLFADAQHYDFTLSPSSPAFGIGFKPLDLSDVGPRE